jgi:hypothetical protein
VTLESADRAIGGGARRASIRQHELNGVFFNRHAAMRALDTSCDLLVMMAANPLYFGV